MRNGILLFLTLIVSLSGCALHARQAASTENLEAEKPAGEGVNNRQKVDPESPTTDTNASPEPPFSEGGTALMDAVFQGKINTVRTLIETGADLSAKSDKGWTALHVTASSPDQGNREHDAELARLLLDSGTYINAQNADGMTPLYLSVMNARPAVRDLLLDAGARPLSTNWEWTPLMRAAYDGDVEAGRALVEGRAAHINLWDKEGWTALHFTAGDGDPEKDPQHAEFARMLIQAGADLNEKTHTGRTPLHLSIANGREDIRKSLLDAGASPNTRDLEGWSPLTLAASKDNLAAVSDLINAGAELEMRDYKGWSALHFTLDSGADGTQPNGRLIAQTLLDAGANPNITTETYLTPLMLAAQTNRPEMARMFLEAGADTRLTDMNFRTAEDIAIQEGHGHIAKLIREYER